MEALVKIWRIIEPRARVLMFLVFIGMATATFVLYQMESPHDEGGAVARSGGEKSADLPDDRSPARHIEQMLYAPPKPIEKTGYSTLIANSMFSVKTVKDQTEREAEANRKFDQANDLTRQRKFGEALALVNEVLRIQPTHSRARELKEKLEARLKE